MSPQLPWMLARVNLDVNGQRVKVWAEHPEDALWTCQHSPKKLPYYHYTEEQRWRHLDSYLFQIYLRFPACPAASITWCRSWCVAMRARVPGPAGKIVFDRFHVMGHVGKAVDTVASRSTET